MALNLPVTPSPCLHVWPFQPFPSTGLVMIASQVYNKLTKIRVRDVARAARGAFSSWAERSDSLHIAEALRWIAIKCS